MLKAPVCIVDSLDKSIYLFFKVKTILTYFIPPRRINTNYYYYEIL